MMLLCIVKNPKKLNGLIVALVAVSAKVAAIVTTPRAAAAKRSQAMDLVTI